MYELAGTLKFIDQVRRKEKYILYIYEKQGKVINILKNVKIKARKNMYVSKTIIELLEKKATEIKRTDKVGQGWFERFRVPHFETGNLPETSVAECW